MGNGFLSVPLSRPPPKNRNGLSSLLLLLILLFSAGGRRSRRIIFGNVTADIAAACGATAADFTLRVTDSGGLFAEATLHVAVTAESTPPVIASVSASPNTLSPPNHRLVLVTVSVSASDNCDAHPVSKIISVTSNEPDSGCGSGDTPNDIQSISGLTVKLRAERCGTGKTGRIYTITVQTKDATGNASTKTTTVKVPK